MGYELKWTPEIDDWLRANVPCKSKKELLERLNKTFNTNFSYNGLTTNMSVKKIYCGIRPYQKGRTNGKCKNIGDEQIKKGYVRVKVAEPNVWKQKQVYLYEQAYNVTVDKYKEIVVFLDGNNRNFDIDNLYLLPRKYIGIVNSLNTNGIQCNLKEKIELAILKSKVLDLAEKTGQASVVKVGEKYKTRRLKSVNNEIQRRYREKETEEHKKERLKKIVERKKEKLEEMKLNDYESYLKWKENYNKKHREYYVRRKQNEK